MVKYLVRVGGGNGVIFWGLRRAGCKVGRAEAEGFRKVVGSACCCDIVGGVVDDARPRASGIDLDSASGIDLTKSAVIVSGLHLMSTIAAPGLRYKTRYAADFAAARHLCARETLA